MPRTILSTLILAPLWTCFWVLTFLMMLILFLEDHFLWGLDQVFGGDE